MICLPDNVLGELVGVLLLVDVAVYHQELLQMVLEVSCVAQKNDPTLDQHSMVMVLSHKMALEKFYPFIFTHYPQQKPKRYRVLVRDTVPKTVL